MWREVLGYSEEFHICGSFETGAALLSAFARLGVHVAIVELALPDCCGVMCVQELLSRDPRVKAVLTTALRGPELLRRAKQAGVSECLIKPLHAGQCLAALRWVSLASTIGGSPVAAPRLRPREEALLTCLAAGLTYKEIADRLPASMASVKKLQHRVFLKLRACSRIEAVGRWRGTMAAGGPGLPLA
jgi:DNA-binding NarL/FixJ family response regulator